MLLKHQNILIASICTLGMLTITNPTAARADFFKDINNTLNNVRGTQENANNAAVNVNNILGGGQSDNNTNNPTNITPISSPTTNNNDSSNTRSGDPNMQIYENYFSWYSGLTPTEQEIVKELTRKYAEDKSMTFADLSKSRFYKGKNEATKSQVSAVFFKFKETIDTVGSQKTKFLAYAFCVNGGGKDCK
jgi:hypothetical protein